jgi:hypothetical protein
MRGKLNKTGPIQTRVKITPAAFTLSDHAAAIMEIGVQKKKVQSRRADRGLPFFKVKTLNERSNVTSGQSTAVISPHNLV